MNKGPMDGSTAEELQKLSSPKTSPAMSTSCMGSAAPSNFDFEGLVLARSLVEQLEHGPVACAIHRGPARSGNRDRTELQ